MLRLVALPLFVTLALPAWLPVPKGVERWLHNAGERTRAAIQDVESGRVDDAAAALETASRLKSDDPLVQYNTGTGRLMSGQGDAEPPLELATQGLQEQPARAADAWYNLGTARLQKHNAAGATQALKEALRRDPHDQNAKFNLEIALARLQEEQQRKQERKRSQASSKKQKTRPSESASSQERSASADQQRKPQVGDKPAPGDAASATQRPTQKKKSPLPQFEAQPDMSAEQAASILQAVENLEREQRRAEAEKRVRRLPNGDKDW
jgi:tetratricopeptide (TPR) repeat protein